MRAGVSSLESLEPFRYYDYLVPVRRSQGLFHSLQATHDLEWSDQVKGVSPGYSIKATVLLLTGSPPALAGAPRS